MSTAVHKPSTLSGIIMAATRFGDFALAGLVVVVICLMVLPIAPWLLDTLLAINLMISAALLMISLYIPGVLQFSTFPSLLLFTTLYRLALNISTTRLILLHAYAGEIINTFGNFVVAGNFVVGAVIFIIILVVQFVVITKGAERVAEVAARFTLDAMPGKQMSVDADVRAGTIDVNEARKRRGMLEQENQLYGAMDGAMKFVKGDAIAGLIITFINILAGLAIGIFQKGMPAMKAVTTYSILTIGDGLVSQIPALLISITAGIMVTRVSSEENQALGKDVFAQLIRQPMAIIIAGYLLLGFALVPGFPKPQFLVLAGLMLALGYTLRQTARDDEDRKKVDKKKRFSATVMEPAAQTPGAKGAAPAAATDEPTPEFSITMPLMLDVADELKEVLSPEALNDQLTEVRRALYHDLGVPFPGIHLRFNVQLTGGRYLILLQEVPISEGVLRPGHLLVRETEENLKLLDIPAEKGADFLPGPPSLWVPESERDKLQKQGLDFMDASRVVTYHLSFVLKRYAGEFVGIQETRFLLDKLAEGSPNLVRELERVLPVQKVAEIFQRLVQEEISIRNLKALGQALIDWSQREKETVLLTEYCRSSLKRWISYKYSGGRNILPVYLLEPNVEETIRKAIRQTSSGSYLALDPSVSEKIVRSIKKEVGPLPPHGPRPVLLTSLDIRRYVRKLTEMELYELPVLSYQELTEEITLQPLARIAL